MTLQEFEAQWHDDSNSYIHARTSGSTGKPKDIWLPKSDMRASARATIERFGLGADSVLALPLPLDYIAGKMMAVRAFESGAELRVIPPSNEFEFDGVADLLAIVPSQVLWLLSHPQWAASVGAVIVGGAPLGIAGQKALAEAGYNAYCTYGMTETCSHVALQKITGKSCCGRVAEPYMAMPGIKFESDDRGCLMIVSNAFSWGRLETNDLVDLVNDTSFFWLGRIDNVINSGGIKIVVEDLEARIAEVFDGEFFIRPMEHLKWGQAVEMVIAQPKLAEGDCAADEQKAAAEKIMAILAKHIEKVKLPKKITFVGVFPRSSTGKILRLQVP